MPINAAQCLSVQICAYLGWPCAGLYCAGRDKKYFAGVLTLGVGCGIKEGAYLRSKRLSIVTPYVISPIVIIVRYKRNISADYADKARL